MDNIKRIQVVFALDDPYQLQQYNHAYNRKNSSGYIKKLIQMDMYKTNPVKPSISLSEPVKEQVRPITHLEEEESEELDFNAGGFI